MSSIDRRGFIGATAAAGVGLAVLPGRYSPAQGQKSTVVRAIRDNAVTDEDVVDAGVVKAMVDETVAKLVGEGSAEAAWKKLFGPDDVVSVKINCLFGLGACTHREVTEAVVAGLQSAGVADKSILVWDRAVGDLLKSGYDPNDGEGVQYIDTAWEDTPTVSGSFNGPLAKIVTRPDITAIVNVPVLKSHSNPGMTLALKNHYGSFKNPNQHHDNNCDPYLTDVNALPVIRDKTRLIVADALRPVGNGGPMANDESTWTYGGIMAATDPVAIDAVGLTILDAYRDEQGMPPIAPKTRFLQTSQTAGLGVCDADKVEVVDI